jgi:hypothetical protein
MATEDPDNGSVRASDADREAVADRLRVALDEGRLTIVEYDERVRDAYAAVTFADLAPLTADLPAPVPAKPSAEVAEQQRDRKKLAKQWREWSGTAFILVGIWAVTSLAAGEPIFFWPIIPMGIWAVVILAGMLFGDDSEDSSDRADGSKGNEAA